MHGCQTSYTNRAFNSLQHGVFYGIFERTVDFVRFFAQLKWSGRVYTLMAVSGLKQSITYYVCMYVYKYSVDIYLMCMIKVRVRWCTCNL